MTAAESIAQPELILPELILYGRRDCHLCDLAEQLLQQTRPQQDYRKVDIETDLHLLRRYGSVIPVLYARTTAAELRWPFDAASLQRWLTQQLRSA
jgi:hypothetical protein